MYQVCLGDETYASVIDRIVSRACAIDDSLQPEACRRLVELVFRARVRKTEACGTHPDCRPIGAVWEGAAAPPDGETGEWVDLDPEGVPAMFAAAAADLTDVPRSRRAVLETRLAAEMRAVIRELVFANPRCGHSRVCRSTPVFPFATLRKR
jgi:hypothetical protein